MNTTISGNIIRSEQVVGGRHVFWIPDAQEHYVRFCDWAGGSAMSPKRMPPQNIDEYIAGFPESVRAILKEMRATIRKAAPQATEKISYQIPTFFLKGNLVHFGAFKDHISFFPTSSGIEKFKHELSVYEKSRGTVRFPMDQPIPLDLIAKIVRFRVQENLEKAGSKKNG
jgi:uncharacterized protein YdhG (YjbR/CyaY superfamily)